MNLNGSDPQSSRVKVTRGYTDSLKLTTSAASHPFTQQIDVLFPASKVIEANFTFRGNYGTARSGIAEVYEYYSNQPAASNAVCLCTSTEEDKWCIDPRGILTLSINKDTYERLGLTGEKLHFKGYSDQFVIRIPLRDNAESISMKAKRKKALEEWDRRRNELWDIAFSPAGPSPFKDLSTLDIRPQTHTSSSIHIPIPSLSPRPQGADKARIEDWNESIHELFEWVGMALLGSQRLEVNDRPDPYIAVYTPPQPTQTGSVSHIRWRGLISSTIVQSIVDAATASLGDDPESFISITSTAISTSPVTYIPQDPTKHSPLRVAREDSEDTWSLFLTKANWVLAESVGGHDARWG